jgi:hypothetical protein
MIQLKHQNDLEELTMINEFNTGHAVKDQFGFYRHLGFSMKHIGADGVNDNAWVGRHDPCEMELNKETFGFYIVIGSKTVHKVEGFKNAKEAKIACNEYLKGV